MGIDAIERRIDLTPGPKFSSKGAWRKEEREGFVILSRMLCGVTKNDVNMIIDERHCHINLAYQDCLWPSYGGTDSEQISIMSYLSPSQIPVLESIKAYLDLGILRIEIPTRVPQNLSVVIQ